MNNTDTDIVIETIPIERIVVLNPRFRDAGKFAEIVDSIDKVGLKQPIKVSRTRGADGEVAYNLVYGQGRMEAFLALGQTEIPAIVTDLSEEDILLSSLVENTARTKPCPGDLFKAIGDLAGRGYSNSKIATKIGYSAEYVGKLRRLMEAGEERLLVAVEAGEIPLKVAIAISEAGSGQAQDVLVDAYESGDLAIYARWCDERGERALPAAPETVAAFVDAMGEVRAPASVRRYVTSIAIAHRALGLEKTVKSPLVRLALKRMYRRKGRRQDQATGLTWLLHQRLMEAAGDRTIDDRNCALLAVAYDAMLRRSELVSLQVSDLIPSWHFCPTHVLYRVDVTRYFSRPVPTWHYILLDSVSSAGGSSCGGWRVPRPPPRRLRQPQRPGACPVD